MTTTTPSTLRPILKRASTSNSSGRSAHFLDNAVSDVFNVDGSDEYDRSSIEVEHNECALPRRFERYIAPGTDTGLDDVLDNNGNVIKGKVDKTKKSEKDEFAKQAAVNAKYAAYLARQQAETEAEGNGCLGGF
ncbi:hypothetical protein CYLTODRAFT_414065 [Cylindrobasidium torrendii FP15055 ss-10]|uniref:Uncharacterized protein n=1 Tax=Cylindrobasidium torrendii FP15055 ss-10 TaxID=1314674 RepID=A0A0D7B1J6_9AGAR|nr:hypothetical protein CYLTODRAFT_414065 [Cylindrobasidium torrendii FP15055 ss-10]